MLPRSNSKFRGDAFNRLLPQSVIKILKHHLAQFSGLLLLCLTIGTSLALWSYSPDDPSLNTSFVEIMDTPSLFSLGFTQNYLQIPGAIAADALLQAMGYSVFAFLFNLLIWSILLLSGRPIPLIFLRIVSLLIGTIFLAQILFLFKNVGNYLVSTTYGGALGQLFALKSLSILKLLFGDKSVFIATPFFSLIFILTFSYALGLKPYQWGKIFKTLVKIGKRIFNALLYIIKWVLDPSISLLAKGERIQKSENSKKKILNPKSFLSLSTSDTNAQIQSRQPELNLGLDILDSALNDNNDSHEGMQNHEDATMKSILQKVSGDDFSGDSYELDHPRSEKKKRTGGLFSSFMPSKVAPLSMEEYELPNIDLLDPLIHTNKKTLSADQLDAAAQQLENVLQEFGVRGEIVGICPGPVVTLYEFRPAAGIKTSRVIGLADDIARSMSAHAARIAVISGRNVIGIELPNPTRDTVYLREILTAEEYTQHPAPLAMILGKDIGGNPIIADLAKMPHLLVAGTTGSGKSVSINTMILSILFRQPPDKCKFIMVDPKMLEFSAYDGIPHLLTPVVTDPKKAVVALKWAVREMENRYRAMSKLGVRNIDGYNARLEEARASGELLIRRVQTGFDPDTGKPIFENQSLDTASLPYIVVVVDEMADLMLVAGKDIEMTVQRLAQMARAAGIHLIMATQRPSVDVITGTIKANFPTRISFMVTSKIDSRTILGEQGAEQLLGQGDMLYMVGGGRLIRVHGPFVKDLEVERIVKFLKSQGEPNYIDSITEDDSDQLMGASDSQQGDALYSQAVEIVRREGKASTSFVQRHLQIGYNRAARMIEQMEKEGIITPANGVGKREVVG